MGVNRAEKGKRINRVCEGVLRAGYGNNKVIIKWIFSSASSIK